MPPHPSDQLLNLFLLLRLPGFVPRHHNIPPLAHICVQQSQTKPAHMSHMCECLHKTKACTTLPRPQEITPLEEGYNSSFALISDTCWEKDLSDFSACEPHLISVTLNLWGACASACGYQGCCWSLAELETLTERPSTPPSFGHMRQCTSRVEYGGVVSFKLLVVVGECPKKRARVPPSSHMCAYACVSASPSSLCTS